MFNDNQIGDFVIAGLKKAQAIKHSKQFFKAFNRLQSVELIQN